MDREVVTPGAEACEEAHQKGQPPSEWHCGLCNKRFSSIQRLRQHNEWRHPESRSEPSHPGTTPSPALRWDDAMLRTLSEARVTQHVPRDVATKVKELMAAQVAAMREEVLARVRPHFHRNIDPDALLADIFQVSTDFTQRDSELDRLRKSKAYVQPKRRYLGTHPETGEVFYAYDNPLDQALEAMFATQPHTFQDVKKLAQRLMSREGLGTADDTYKPDLVISDTFDGSGTHSFIKQFSFGPGKVPLFFIFYYDGLELVNGLGQARLTHELGCFYWALLPLDQVYRLNSVHLRIATLCYQRAISCSEIGMHTVIHGRADQQTQSDCHAWGLWMRRIRKGYSLQTPEGEATGLGGTVLLAADTPAAAKCVGTKQSVGPSTKSICRSCHCIQTPGPASFHRSPNSFLAGLPGWKEHCKGRTQNFPLRSKDDLHEYLRKGQAVLDGAMSWTDFQRWTQDMGVNDFAAALADTPCPMDIMHIVFEGIARQLLGALSYVGLTTWKWEPWQIVERLRLFTQEQGWSRHTLPYVNSSRLAHLSKGETGGLPSSDASFPGTAMQVATLILYVDGCFGPLLSEDQRRNPVWQVAIL